jgi:hypothetical protein
MAMGHFLTRIPQKVLREKDQTAVIQLEPA